MSVKKQHPVNSKPAYILNILLTVIESGLAFSLNPANLKLFANPSHTLRYNQPSQPIDFCKREDKYTNRRP